MRLGDILVRAINEHPVVSIVLLLALFGVFHAATHVVHGDK